MKSYCIGLVLCIALLIRADLFANVYDSFLRDDVKPADYGKLTAKAKKGLTHLESFASGFFVTKDGYILTNHHVVDGAEEIVVIRHKTAYRANVVARNREHDLALLKISLFPKSKDGLYDLKDGIPTVQYLPVETKCFVGQTVYAIGFPQTDVLGYEAKVTRGIVSSLSGIQGREDIFQMDAMITYGNSGSPIVNEYGHVIGVACSGARISENYNYGVKMEEVLKFLPQNVKTTVGVPMRKPSVLKMTKDVISATVFILIYKEGCCQRIEHTTVDPSGQKKRERETAIRKAQLDAKLCKIKKDWTTLKKITDWLEEQGAGSPEMKELNDLARDELGLHLIIRAEADGRDVSASVTPITGFKDSIVVCDRPITLYGGASRKSFDVEAKLRYEDEKWVWSGVLKCMYDWRGTKEIRVVLKRVEVK